MFIIFFIYLFILINYKKEKIYIYSKVILIDIINNY